MLSSILETDIPQPPIRRFTCTSYSHAHRHRKTELRRVAHPGYGERLPLVFNCLLKSLASLEIASRVDRFGGFGRLFRFIPSLVQFDEKYEREIKRIRNRVFTKEQQIDEEKDFDGQDPGAVHVLVACQGQYVGTGRMLADGHIGRLAVLKAYRGRGLGASVLLALITEAKSKGMTRVYLGAQKHATGFYEKLGFSVYGEPYMEVNIEHVQMEMFV